MDKKKGVLVGSLIALAVMGACRKANAESFFQIEAGSGSALYGLTDGKWFQDGAPGNKVKSVAPAISVGLTGNLIDHTNWGLDWHADLNYMGTASAGCRCTISDDDYNTATKTVKAGATLESYYGSGHMMGVSFMLEPYLRYQGWKLGVAAGVFGYRKTWSESVSGWAGNFGNPQPVPVHLESSHGISFAPAAGIDITHGNMTLSYRYYMVSRSQGKVPPLWNDVQTLQILYRF